MSHSNESIEPWEADLEEVFFGTVEPALNRPTLEPMLPPQPIPIDVHDDIPVVVAVVPRWVYPTVFLLSLVAVGGVAFGLGARSVTPSTTVEPVVEVPAEVAAEPLPTEVEVPKKPTSRDRKRARRSPPDAVAPAKAAPVATPEPVMAKAQDAPPAAPVDWSKVKVPSTEPTPPAPGPVSPSALPAALELRAMTPGAAL